MRYFYISFILMCTLSCSGNNQPRELSEFETEHGIGPITTEIDLGIYDSAIAEQGRQIYNTLCIMCHGQNDSDIAPTLEGILERRSHEYVMNMILNPTGMVRWHPSRSDDKKYLTSMPYQTLTAEEARALVEYLRGESLNNSL